MSRIYKPALWVHLILCVILGALLLIIPGRTLQAIGWAPVDPILSRVLGAALLAMAWGDWRVRRSDGAAQVRLWAEVQFAFCALAGIGVLRHLVVGRWPAPVWILFVALVLYAAVWLGVLRKERG